MPLWPAGLCGSITHSKGMAAAVVASRQHWQGIGLDAEPLMSPSRSQRLAGQILTPDELQRLQVSRDDSPGGKASAPIFIDASLDHDSVYVQAQAVLTLRIYHSVSLYNDSSLTPLKMDDARIEQLGQARTYEKDINGVRHGVKT